MNGPIIEPSLDLAVIRNYQVSGLIDPLGRIVWACLPRPDADPTFCSLLRREGGASERGVFAFDLAAVAEHEQHYRINTVAREDCSSAERLWWPAAFAFGLRCATANDLQPLNPPADRSCGHF